MPRDLERLIEELNKQKRPLWEEIDPLDDLFEMVSIKPNMTGLSNFVWAGIKNPQHADRIKVTNSPRRMDWEDAFVVTIEDEPRLVAGICTLSAKDLNKVFEFIKLNKKVLLDLSNHKLPTIDFLKKIKKV